MSGTACLLLGDVMEQLATLPSESVHCVVTSPPYWGLRDYGVPGQLGLEPTPQEHIARMVEVFGEVRRVLRKDGTAWVNYGDCYAANRTEQVADSKGGASATRSAGISSTVPLGLKAKDLCMMPHRLAIALQDDGWWVRCDIVWNKPNPMPESVTDRPVKSHEYIFLLSKSARYFYDAEAIREKGAGTTLTVPAGWATEGEHTAVAWMKERTTDKQRGHSRRHAGFNDRWDLMPKEEQAANGRSKRSVWTVATHPYPAAHFATFPPDLIRPCILAGTSERGVCPKCGGPWERDVNRVVGVSKPCPKTDTAHHARGGHGTAVGTLGKSGSGRINGFTETLDWQPSCKCAAGEAVPATILDPFLGSGTTGAVALEYGRNIIGIELNPEYLELAKCRIAPYLEQERLAL